MIIPPEEVKQLATKQIQPRPDTDRLQVPTRTRSEKNKERGRRRENQKKCRHRRKACRQKQKKQAETPTEHSGRSRKGQGAETAKTTTEQKKTDLGQAAQRSDASYAISKDHTDYTRTRGAQAPGTYRTSPINATMQTTEGCYEAELTE